MPKCWLSGANRGPDAAILKRRCSLFSLSAFTLQQCSHLNGTQKSSKRSEFSSVIEISGPFTALTGMWCGLPSWSICISMCSHFSTQVALQVLLPQPSLLVPGSGQLDSEELPGILKAWLQKAHGDIRGAAPHQPKLIWVQVGYPCSPTALPSFCSSHSGKNKSDPPEACWFPQQG